MHVRVKLTDTASSFLKGIRAGLPSRMAMGALASKAKILIEQRTLEGKDEDGASFDKYRTAPYSAPVTNRPPGYPDPSGGDLSKSGKSMKFSSYAAYKQGLGFGEDVNLSVSNQMLSDIDWTVRSSTKALMFFTSRLSGAKASGHHEGYYPFFGLGDQKTEEAMNVKLREVFRDVRAKARAEAKARKARSK